jgi:hypothetical protein
MFPYVMSCLVKLHNRAIPQPTSTSPLPLPSPLHMTVDSKKEPFYLYIVETCVLSFLTNKFARLVDYLCGTLRDVE